MPTLALVLGPPQDPVKQRQGEQKRAKRKKRSTNVLIRANTLASFSKRP